MNCSFTGHRQIDKNHIYKISDILDRAVAYAYKEGCRSFFSGGAIGFDTYAAKAVLKFRLYHPDVKLCLALPCTNQDEKWNDEQKEMYAYLLREADEVVYISEEYTPTCMAERNRYLAEKADILISYVSRTRSGAAQTVRMVQKLGKPIYNLYPALENEGKETKNEL
jgi:uncharacterized phage-like protein YoqJ